MKNAFFLTLIVAFLLIMWGMMSGCGVAVEGSFDFKNGAMVGGSIGLKLPVKTTQPTR